MRKSIQKIEISSLLISLLLMELVPFIVQLYRTHLLVVLPDTNAISIAGNIEWFDTINETIQAFLIVPLFSVLGKYRDTIKAKIRLSFIIVNSLYAVFLISIIIYASSIVSHMEISWDIQQATTEYIKTESIAFFFANNISFAIVVLVMVGSSEGIYVISAVRLLASVIGDFSLIPKFGAIGVAYSNGVSSIIGLAICTALLRKRFVSDDQNSINVSNHSGNKEYLRYYSKIGVFSGSQILLDNVIYVLVICKMVNAVSEQGNYWVANNIIWGLFLIPVSALSSYIKKQSAEGKEDYKFYKKILLYTFAAWAIIMFVIKPFLEHVIMIEDATSISNILTVVMPFYVAYAISQVFDSIFTGRGQTKYLFAISVCVNLIYYPVIYILVLRRVFVPSITFICMMFGFGMVLHMGLSIVFWKRSERCKQI